MKLEEILNEWDRDVIIDQNVLDDESLKTPKLHSKYLRYYSTENLLYNKMLAEFKIMKSEKHDFLLYGKDKIHIEKGWELPSQGNIIKSELDYYLEHDKDLIQETLKLSYQKEKVNTLKAIIDLINNRSFHINTALKFKLWSSGQ